MAKERDFQLELKNAQASVKEIGGKREKLGNAAAVEEANVRRSVEALISLGIADAGTLSVEQIKALREKSQAELEKNLDKLNKQIEAANQVLVEYEAVSA